MNIIKANRNGHYTVINNSIFQDKRISLKSRGLFATIMSLPDNWEISIKGLSKILKENKDSIMTAINELILYDYCIRIPVKNKGKFAGYDYTFNETPKNKPCTEKPYPDYSDTDKSDTENPQQLSTKDNKVNKDKIKKNNTTISSENYLKISLEDYKQRTGNEYQQWKDKWISYANKNICFYEYFNNKYQLSNYKNPFAGLIDAINDFIYERNANPNVDDDNNIIHYWKSSGHFKNDFNNWMKYNYQNYQ